jgi:hypothetical protein
MSNTILHDIIFILGSRIKFGPFDMAHAVIN